ncbi:MAG: DUF2157 domain-containing protein [Campylobacteraceae bacterium]|jgi:uncharacterized membrane protein|nr:DUF2157 domain-containing protein [Campylobacteraceae bacterium]
MKTPIAWLENELPLWVKDSLITQENADTLLSKYKNSNVSVTISAALIIFGSALVGLGIISLFAYNWEFLSRPFKAVLAVILLLLAQCFALWVKRHKEANLGYSEAASLTLFLAFICSLAIISQTYNMGGDIMDFLRISAIFSIPIVYFFNSRSVAFLLFGIIIYIIIESKYDFTAWLLLSSWLPWYILHLKNHRYANSSIFLNLIFFAGVLIISIIFCNESRQILLAILLTLSSFWMLGILLYNEQERFYRRIFEMLSKTGILIFLIFFCYPSSTLEFSNDISNVRLVYWLLFAALFTVFCYLKKERLFELLLPLSPLLFYLLTTNENIDISITLSLFVATGAFAMIYGGAKKADIMLTNQGLIVISILMLIYFFNSNFSILAKGFAFILTGTLFIGANIFLRRYLKDKK